MTGRQKGQLGVLKSGKGRIGAEGGSAKKKVKGWSGSEEGRTVFKSGKQPIVWALLIMSGMASVSVHMPCMVSPTI